MIAEHDGASAAFLSDDAAAAAAASVNDKMLSTNDVTTMGNSANMAASEMNVITNSLISSHDGAPDSLHDDDGCDDAAAAGSSTFFGSLGVGTAAAVAVAGMLAATGDATGAATGAFNKTNSSSATPAAALAGMLLQPVELGLLHQSSPRVARFFFHFRFLLA